MENGTTLSGQPKVSCISYLFTRPYGFSTNTTRIQIFTEIYNDLNPQRTRRPIQIEADERRRSQMASPDFIDNTLSIGGLFFGAGRAYLGSATQGSENAALVAKEWLVTDEGRRFLVESIEYSGVREQIQALPECNPVGSSEGASINTTHKSTRKAYASIPHRSGARSRLHAANIPAKRMASARSGFVIDYEATLDATTSGRVFTSDVTYYMRSAHLSLTVTENGGGFINQYTWGSTRGQHGAWNERCMETSDKQGFKAEWRAVLSSTRFYEIVFKTKVLQSRVSRSLKFCKLQYHM
jgi:hypothetical protein